MSGVVMIPVLRDIDLDGHALDGAIAYLTELKTLYGEDTILKVYVGRECGEPTTLSLHKKRP